MNKKIYATPVRITWLIFICLWAVSLSAQEKEVMGWVEKILIVPNNITLVAKLDTGADSSSINSQNIVEFTKKGKKWVKFIVKNRFGHEDVLEAEVIDTTKIKRIGGKPKIRPVIKVGICLGSVYMEEEVNLANRSKFEYQVLIGRSVLAGNFIVDPAVTFTTAPNCKREKTLE